MDCSSMLESKLVHFTSSEDLLYFLQSSDANNPQVISSRFTEAFDVLVSQAMREDRKEQITVLLQCMGYLIMQDQVSTMCVLVQSGFHNIFEKINSFLHGQWSSKKVSRPPADQLLDKLINVMTIYVKKMKDKYNWFINTMFYPLMKIIGSSTAYYRVRLTCAEALLAICSTLHQEVVNVLRQYVCVKNPNLSPLCFELMQNLGQIGHYQLQESIVELMFRIWSTDRRKLKALMWCNNNKQLAEKLMAITYEQFDRGVRLFLNALNGSVYKRRVLTLAYKELKIGKEKLVPGSERDRWIDLCYESKQLCLNYSVKLQNEKDEFLDVGAIKTDQVSTFETSNNRALETVDLNISLTELASEIFPELPMKETLSTSITIRFVNSSNPPFDAKGLQGFISALFGPKCTRESPRSLKVSKTMNAMARRMQRSSTSPSSQQSMLNTSTHSFVHLPGKSQHSTSQRTPLSPFNSQRLSQALNNSFQLQRNQDIVPSSQPNNPVRVSKPPRSMASGASSTISDSGRSRMTRPMNNKVVPVHVHAVRSEDGSLKQNRYELLNSRTNSVSSIGSLEHLPNNSSMGIPSPAVSNISKSSNVVYPQQAPTEPTHEMSQHNISGQLTSSQSKRSNRMLNNLAIRAIQSKPSQPSFQFSGRHENKLSHATPASKNLPHHGYKSDSAISLPPSSINSQISSSRPIGKLLDSSSTKVPSHASKVSSHVTSSSKVSSHASKVLSHVSPNLLEDSLHLDLPSQSSSKVPSHATSSKTSRSTRSKGKSGSKNYESEPTSTKSNPIMQFVDKLKLKSKKKPSKDDVTDSSDAFQEKSRTGKKQKQEKKPLKEIIKDSNNNAVEWNELVPETQAVTAHAEKKANESTDLMLSQLMPENTIKPQEIPTTSSQIQTRSSQRSKKIQKQDIDVDLSPEYPSSVLSVSLHQEEASGKKSPKLQNVENSEQMKVDEVIEQANKQAETKKTLTKEKTALIAEKVNAEFQKLRFEFPVEDGMDKILEPQKKSAERKKGKQSKSLKGKENVPPGSEKKKRRSLVNTDLAEPLEDLSINDPGLYVDEFQDTIIKSAKRLPYVAKFMKNKKAMKKKVLSESSTAGSKMGNRKKKVTKLRRVTVEIFKTDSDSKTTATQASATEEKESVRESSTSSTFTEQSNNKVKDTREMKEFLKKAKKIGDKKRKEKQKATRTKRAGVLHANEATTTSNDDAFEIETIRDAPVFQEAIKLSPEPITLKSTETETTLTESDEVTGDTTDTITRIWTPRKKQQSSSGEEYIPPKDLSDTVPEYESPEKFFAGMKAEEEKEKQKNKVSEKKKKPRVSFDDFDFNLHEVEEKQKRRQQARDMKPKRIKKSKLFESTSSAASASGSDLSWIADHKKNQESTILPKPLKTFRRKNTIKSTSSSLNLLLPTPILNTDVLGKSEFSSPEKVRSEKPNRVSLRSSLTRMVDLATACNVSFDDIVLSDDDKVQKKLVEENPPNDDSHVSSFEEEVPEFTGISMYETRAWETAAEEGEMQNINFNSAMKKKQMQREEEKQELPEEKQITNTPSTTSIHELARRNNETPALGKAQPLKIDKPKKAHKRKASEDSSSNSSTHRLKRQEQVLKSKKMLNMVNGGESASVSHIPELDSSSSSDGPTLPAPKFIKLMGGYLTNVKSVWAEGNAKRTKDLEEFQDRMFKCDEKHAEFVGEIKHLESETLNFISKMDKKVSKVMNKAASNIVGVKSLHAELTEKIQQRNNAESIAMDNLKMKISVELKEMIRKTNL